MVLVKQQTWASLNLLKNMQPHGICWYFTQSSRVNQIKFPACALPSLLPSLPPLLSWFYHSRSSSEEAASSSSSVASNVAQPKVKVSWRRHKKLHVTSVFIPLQLVSLIGLGLVCQQVYNVSHKPQRVVQKKFIKKDLSE